MLGKHIRHAPEIGSPLLVGGDVVQVAKIAATASRIPHAKRITHNLAAGSVGAIVYGRADTGDLDWRD